MATFKSYLQGKRHSKATIELVERNLFSYLNWCEESRTESETAEQREILNYIKSIQKREVKQRTVQLYIRSLKHYYDWLIKREIREENPINQIDIKGVKRQFLYEILNKQELEKLYHDFKTTENEKDKNQNWYKNSLLVGKRNKAILGLLIWQGLGSREIAKLKVEDLQLREGKIKIKGGRNYNERILPLEATQIMDLMEYNFQIRTELLKVSQKESDLLFISSGKSNSLGNVMFKLMKKLKVQNPKITSAKQIRASVITYWLKNYNLRETQYKAGHRYVSSTEAYLVNDLDDLQEDILKFHPL
ncbi:MAG: hypothetical protein CMH30_05735 [Micavibrio sp.]|nr:hypothetical protein [Micavibrio sp.]|tara:strand:+ start:4430 stop:5341 length:912 start_codon:yes stop_codon:yes gene_type:complete